MSKIIHYCWFGGSEKPPIVKKCIDSWKEYFPDFEIMEWNEQNFDIHNNRYVEEAYQSKKYAFVSDVARFYALEKFGGLYFDTDVEVIKDFAPLLDQEAFAGFETDEYINPRLVLWVKEKNNRFSLNEIKKAKRRLFAFFISFPLFPKQNQHSEQNAPYSIVAQDLCYR